MREDARPFHPSFASAYVRIPLSSPLLPPDVTNEGAARRAERACLPGRGSAENNASPDGDTTKAVCARFSLPHRHHLPCLSPSRRSLSLLYLRKRSQNDTNSALTSSVHSSRTQQETRTDAQRKSKQSGVRDSPRLLQLPVPEKV